MGVKPLLTGSEEKQAKDIWEHSAEKKYLDLRDIDEQKTGENSMILILHLVLLKSLSYVHAEIKIR